ncbi:MAG TPA: VWA domain-containing protein, partial [Rhodothermales bacterium]|nr:VWA domain-containing protein [Rhodothermales bacterium]
RRRVAVAEHVEVEDRARGGEGELELFGFSTALPDTAVADGGPPGFLLFVAEPDPGDATETIAKVFTLIVDRSGSMIGNKIVQARAAARFIVNNLNPGDRFNIVDFATDVRSFRPTHVEYTPANRDAALAYVNAIVASGNTNISGAFSTAIPQFAAASDTTANIVVFFTDGQATSGITQTDPLLAHVRNLITQTETGVLLFTFGIGSDVNRQLLTLLATQNDGLVEFLDDDEVEDRISSFYLTIRNPVLLNATVAFSPAVVTGVHPEALPNLYKGRQMIVSGRYSEAVPVTITLSGDAFGHPVSYAYTLDLIESADPGRLFLTKVWAKLTIEDLLIRYYALSPTSAAALALRAQIIELSLQFGVLSPFTSLTPTNPPNPTENEDEPAEEEAVAGIVVLGNSPNPFHASTTLRFEVGAAVAGQVVLVRIYNTLGQLIRVLTVRVDGPGAYEVTWDGRLATGLPAPSGVYVYVLEAENAVASGRMTLLR